VSVALALVLALSAQKEFEAWNRPIEPFRVIANIHYVGVAGLSSFLITTPEGHILIDSALPESVPHIRAGVEKLGFRFGDIKVLLASHAHIDHVGGHAQMKELTGAQVMAMGKDAAVIESGGKGDFLFEGEFAWKPCKVDRVLKDRDTVSLGGVTLTARWTPGHTKGCTTWTTVIEDGGRKLDVVLIGGTNIVRDTKVSGMPKYPEIETDYRRTFEVLKSLRCDVFLAPHPFQFGMEEKLKKLGAGANPFIDPEGYRARVDNAEKAFMRRLDGERK